jgi:hypothetical protein
MMMPALEDQLRISLLDEKQCPFLTSCSSRTTSAIWHLLSCHAKTADVLAWHLYEEVQHLCVVNLSRLRKILQHGCSNSCFGQNYNCTGCMDQQYDTQ